LGLARLSARGHGMSRSVAIIDPAVPTADREAFIRENAVALVRTLEEQLVRLRKRMVQIETSRECLRETNRRLRIQNDQLHRDAAHVLRHLDTLRAELAALKQGSTVVAVHHATEPDHDRPPGAQR
jgi:hypothetical protein